MAKKRIWVPNQHYHVINRGIRKDTLFHDQKDYEFFLQLIERIYVKYTFQITSFCLMKNHYHLEICSNETPLSTIMHDINCLYARYYNCRFNFRGPVFENRFYSKHVKDNRGLLHLTRYIHFNPLEAKVVKSPEQYRWSSMQYYLPNYQSPLPSYMNLSPILDQFSGTEIQKKTHFIEWCGF